MLSESKRTKPDALTKHMTTQRLVRTFNIDPPHDANFEKRLQYLRSEQTTDFTGQTMPDNVKDMIIANISHPETKCRDIYIDITSISSGTIIDLVSSLQHSSCIEQFRITTQNQIGTMDVLDTQWDVLRGHPTLEIVSFQNISFGKSGAVSLARLISHDATSWTYLKLSQCSFGGEGLDIMMEAMAQNTCIRYFKWTPSRSDQKYAHCATSLITMLRRNHHIQRLELKDLMLTDEQVVSFADMLEKHPSITTFMADSWEIYESRLTTILNAVKNNQRLEVLITSEMSIEHDHVKILSELLEQTTTLRSLNIHNEVINHEDIVTIAHGLAANKTLKTLTLSDQCRLTLDSLLVMMRALKHNVSLDKLVMDIDPMNPETFETWCVPDICNEMESIIKSCVITRLHIGMPHIFDIPENSAWSRIQKALSIPLENRELPIASNTKSASKTS